MLELLPKLLRWAICVFLFVFAISMLSLTQQDNPFFLIAPFFALAFVYWLFNSKNGFPKEILPITILTVLVGAFASNYIRFIPLHPFNGDFYHAWLAWCYVIGFPSVYWGFNKFGD